jgi:L-asparaginase
MKMSIILVAHAGAWNEKSEVYKQIDIKAVNDAVNVGILKDNLIDIAVETVVFLENHEKLDAGLGSILQLDGKPRVDSAIASNDKRYAKRYAGILQLRDIKNPSRVAKRLLEYGYHAILSGEGAMEFALKEGFERENLITDETQNALQAQLEFLGLREGELPNYSDLANNKTALDSKKLSTVGAVVVDTQTATLVSVTSTGGLAFGYPCRVGDTALFGHGIYCDEFVAVACTGEGDKMIEYMSALRVGLFYKETNDIQKSIQMAVDGLKNELKGECGLIAVDKYGHIGIAKSTSFLATATAVK